METEISTSTWMLLFFVLFLFVSLWKISAFLPNKPLEDDDTSQEAAELLEQIMLKIIVQKKGKLTLDELFVEISKDEAFDAKRFWRFNRNKLQQLLNTYYAKNTNTATILDIYKGLK